MKFVSGSRYVRMASNRKARAVGFTLVSSLVIIGGLLIIPYLMTPSADTATTTHPVSGATAAINKMKQSAESIDCGSWGNPSNATSSARALLATSALSRAHASFAECGFTGRSWVMLFQTSGSTASPGTAMFEISHCELTSPSCASSTMKPALSSWKLTEAPVPGAPSLIGNPYPGALIFDISGHQLVLDTSSGAWISGDAIGNCAAAWGKTSASKSGLEANPAEQEAFLRSNPNCD